jgi:cytoskeletal protein RodZ
MSQRGSSSEPQRQNLLRKRPLSPEVYRRRRIIVGVMTLVVAVLLYQLFMGVLGLVGNLIAPPAEASPQQTQSQTTSDPTTQEPTSDPTTDPTESTKIEACDLANIAVSIEISGGPQFTVDESVIIKATIKNTGPRTCRRDVGAASNEIYVQNSASKEVWSSDRCPITNDKALVSMVPGSEYRIRLEWNGTSNPTQCDRQGSHVPAGEYLVFARNGNAKSAAAVITFT